MSDAAERASRIRPRREPPPLIEVHVVANVEITDRLRRLTFAGPGLAAMIVEPAASVRLLVPSPGSTDLVLPTWTGNEFLLPGDIRPALRTFTPLAFPGATSDPDRLDIEIVRHAGGVVSQWAETAPVGAPAAISGPGRGFAVPPDASVFHLLGDETAVPAIGQLLEWLPPTATISVHAEVTTASSIRNLPEHPGATLTWYVRSPDDPPGAALVDAATALPALTADHHVWAAGEAASMQAIRTQLFTVRGVPRSQATVRGYWKPRG